MSEEDRALLRDSSAEEVWQMLGERFEAVRLTPDSSMAVDLGVDSLEWVDLTLDIRDRTGVELEEEQTAEIETVRDLLTAVRDASEPSEETSGDVLENPEKFLSDEERDWLRPLGKVEVLLAWMLYWINRGLMRAFFRLRVDGLDNVRKAEQVAILPNHTSYLDGFVIMAALPFDFLRHASVAGSAELAFRTPVHRAVMRLSRALPIQGNRAALSSLALPLMKLRQGSHLVWFPEGRRSRHGELLNVRPGIGMLLAREPATVIPTIIDGAYEAMPLGRTMPRPRQITVRFGQPVSVDDLSSRGEGEEPRERIAHAIGKELAALKSDVGS
jgi:long-chain acyl-CoA synthetase